MRGAGASTCEPADVTPKAESAIRGLSIIIVLAGGSKLIMTIETGRELLLLQVPVPPTWRSP